MIGVMMGSISALARREIRRFHVDRSRLLFDMVWPLMILLVLGFGVDAFAPPKDDLSYVAFLGPGVIGLLLVRMCVAFGRVLEHEARQGYREYLVTPVPRQIIIFGSFVGRWIIHSIVATVILAAYIGILWLAAAGARSVEGKAAFIPSVSMIGFGVLAVFLAVACALAAGVLLAVFVSDVRLHVRKAWLTALTLVLISGVLFPVADLPFGLEYLAYLSPLTYMVDAIRGAVTGVSLLPFAWSAGVTAAIALLGLAVGLWKSKGLLRV